MRNVLIREVANLQKELERNFGNACYGSYSSRPARWMALRHTSPFPQVNIRKDEENLYVEALAPGVDPETLKLSVINNTLTIAGERKAAEGVNNEQYSRRERTVGEFSRSIKLPTEVDVENVGAEFTNGILVVTLPKAESAKPRQIQVAVR